MIDLGSKEIVDLQRRSMAKVETPEDMARRLIGPGCSIRCSNPMHLTHMEVMDEVFRRKGVGPNTGTKKNPGLRQK